MGHKGGGAIRLSEICKKLDRAGSNFTWRKAEPIRGHPRPTPGEQAAPMKTTDKTGQERRERRGLILPAGAPLGLLLELDCSELDGELAGSSTAQAEQHRALEAVEADTRQALADYLDTRPTDEACSCSGCSGSKNLERPNEGTGGRFRTGWHGKFLRLLRLGSGVSLAARACGVSRSTPYRHRAELDGFGQEWEAAHREAVERLEATIRLRALEGDTQALVFLLRALDPERYGKGAQSRSGCGCWCSGG